MNDGTCEKIVIPCSCSISCCLFLAALTIGAWEEGTTCLREAASAEAGEIVQLQRTAYCPAHFHDAWASPWTMGNH